MKSKSIRLSAGALAALLAAPIFADQVFVPISPQCRVFDTREVGSQTDGNPLPNPGPHSFRIQGNCGVPDGASAVSGNVTVVNASRFGDLRLYPFDSTPGLNDPSSINYVAVEALANSFILPLSPVSDPSDDDMKVIIGMTAPGTVHVIIDVSGYFVDLEAGDGIELTPGSVVVNVMDCEDGEILLQDGDDWTCADNSGGLPTTCTEGQFPLWDDENDVWVCAGGGGGLFGFSKADIYATQDPSGPVDPGSDGEATAECTDTNDIPLEGYCDVNPGELLIAAGSAASGWTASDPAVAASFTCYFHNFDTENQRNGHARMFCVSVPAP